MGGRRDGQRRDRSPLGTRREIVSKWRKRFFEQGLPGLEERPRGGRPQSFPPEVAVAVKALACELPSRLGVPLSRLHVPDIRSESSAGGCGRDPGDDGVALALRGRDKALEAPLLDLPRDPAFEERPARLRPLRPVAGKPPRDDDYVISADEKTSLQARLRCHRRLGPGAGRACVSSTSTTGAAPPLPRCLGRAPGRSLAAASRKQASSLSTDLAR